LSTTPDDPPAPCAATPRWTVTTEVDDLQEGLFGQVLLWVFELLPWLDARGLRPAWDIRSRLYGTAPGHRVLPGVFDLAYVPAAAARRRRSLLWLRVAHVSVLGNDWAALHGLWQRYFRVPPRIAARADAFGLPPDCLGLHYRGTDKNGALADTNPVDPDDFLALAAAFVAERPVLRAIFLASDEPGMLARTRARFPTLPVLGLGDIAFHKAPADGPEKADRALLDCVLLSRCRVVLKCSSALSGFAKVLVPQLECYRVSASKIFHEVPYFPDAYIPRLKLREPAAQAILARQFAGDWLDSAGAVEPTRFSARPRYRADRIAINTAKFALARLLGRTRRA